MSVVVLDDHLLRDVLADEVSDALAPLIADHRLATTNLYYLRLSQSVAAARGGLLTGSWPRSLRRQLGRALIQLDEVQVVPMDALAFRIAELASYGLSTLGAEAAAAAEHLDATLCVWDGDDGHGLAAAMAAMSLRYVTVSR